ncbi:MAG: Asp-tRNA(Asn)/Glu-tRNA(Gln) amidotransferase subunit GatC [bacterium]|nr:Asp-tRNA(Asn)/Glu-tRNA(Gln) amidotransferase subunit GatC [bacterium]
MELSHDAVRAIAELAKLELTDDEIALYAGQLSHILGYFEKLQTLDTSHIEATASVLPLHNVLRPDVPGQPLPIQEVTANAPDSYADQFRVSAVLDE